MKYPQLVSSRAVSEISEWLIKRLEDLDIEQPSVYSRLLLSLLHTPFKANAIDLLELPQLKDLKQPYHLLNKNNEQLKRLAAVESLMEVSAEQNKSNIISLVDELHLKLRKVESSCDEGAIIGRGSSIVASTSPAKFYKNLKKIKRNHGSENPTKNYYLAFPALSSKKATTTVTSVEGKQASPGAVREATKDPNLQLLCWSSLMSSKDSSHAPSSSTAVDVDKLRNVVKMKTPRRKRRYGRTVKSGNKSDVQCKAKSYEVYECATVSPKVKNGSKKHQRNQYVTSKPPATKSCSGARGYNSTKMDFPPGSAPWDMDFKGHWEMDRDLIGEFIQQQHHQKHPIVAKSANQVEQAMGAEDDVMLMKFLPTKLMDDDGDGAPIKMKEAQSISSLKSKFDANVKALWNDDPLTKPSTHKSFDDGNASLVSSFTSEKNSLGLFNFNGHQPREVIAPCTNLQMYSNSSSADFMNISDYDYNNNSSGRGTVYKTHLAPSSTVSPGADRFIKSGTNLQTSIWSDGEFTCEPESLIYKDVVDHTDDAIYKRMKSIGAEMKNWQKSCVPDDEGDVSLFNHSEVSAFKRFRPLMAPTIIRANYHPNNAPQKDFSAAAASTDESENLLTSEKTHFSPIIRDGHTFVIDNNWDEIKYERTASGCLTYNNKRCMKWKNAHQANDDNNNHCNGKIDLEAMEDDANEFSIKFLVKDENDKGCQTDINEFVRTTNRSLVINEEYCKRKIYDEYFKGNVGEANNKWRYHLNADDSSNDYSFFSVNRVKNNAGAAKTLQDILVSSNSSSSSICTITSSSYETSAVDPFESWRSIKVDNGGMLDSDYKQACMHSLWEQCTTCTRNDSDYYEEKSIPANRLLKDELRMDGDEIMNVIQNLYITSDYCDDEEEKDDDDCEDMNHFYMDMLDDSMDGSGIAEEESKFYEADGTKAEKGKKTLTPNMFDAHQREELLQLENFDEITMAKMQWQWDKNRETEKDQEKYLKLLKWIQASLLKEDHPDSNNNNCQLSSEERRTQNRKRRHSTCQNFMEKKTSRSQDLELTYHLNLSHSPTAAFIEDNLFVDAAKMLKVNIEKILLITDPNSSEIEHGKDENGANYYRNILQQQHALIKQMDLARPLTR